MFNNKRFKSAYPFTNTQFGKSGGVPDTWTANNATLSAQDASLVAYWKGEDTADSVGSYTLTNNNSTTFTSGKNNNAFTGGGTRFMSVATSTAFYINGDYTINTWVKFGAFGSYNMMLSCGGWGVVSANLDGWVLLYNNLSNELQFKNKTTGIAESWSPSLSTFYMVTISVISGVAHAYINGSELGSGTAMTFAESVTDLKILASGDGGGFLNGWIDEVAIYKGYGADQTFISALYNSTVGSFRV